ncbi:MAG: hypothetical protein V9E89_18700 [Ilumatobacteraceae bacterium]
MPVRQGRLGEWLRGERRPRTARARRRSRALIAGFGVLTLATSFAAISVGLAENRCIGGQECDNEAGQAVIQPSPSGTTPNTVAAPRATSPQATVPSPGSTPVAASQPTTTTTTSPQAPRPPLAIGESVMLGAAPNLTAGGIKVDAVTSRQGSGVAELLELIAPMGIIPSTVIIQTGTNGSVSAKTFARIMEQLPPAKVPRVFFLTVKAPRSWIEGNNALIRALPQTYPNVTVIDWERDAGVDRGRAEPLRRADPPAHPHRQAVLRQHDLPGRRPDRSGQVAPAVDPGCDTGRPCPPSPRTRPRVSSAASRTCRASTGCAPSPSAR